jgi:exosome complex component RRP40
MEAKIGDIVLPGEVAKDSTLEKASNKNKVLLGPGLKRDADNIYICRAGVFKKKYHKLWVDGLQKHYIPARDETVVGVVTKKTGDYFRVDIGASEQATIYFLAFEGATKKIRPMLNIGDVIFAKLLMACPDMEPELVCVNSVGSKEKLGILPEDGFLFTCSLHLVRKILSPHCKLLKILGEGLKFEIAIGMNGKIWIKGVDVDTTIAVGDAILDAEILTNSQIEKHCRKIVRHFSGRIRQ